MCEYLAKVSSLSEARTEPIRRPPLILYFHATPEMEATEKKEEKQPVETKEEVTPATETAAKEESTEKVPELTAEEKLKKREAEMTKGTQKLLEEKKQSEKELQLYKDIVSEGKKIAGNENLLIDLYYTKPEVAQGILDEYYNGITFDEFVKSKELDDNIPAKIEARATEKADEIIRQKEVKSAIEAFKKEMGYDEETAKLFQDELDDAVGDKLTSITPEKIEKYLIKAHKLTVLNSEEYKEVKKQEKIASQAGIGEGTSGSKGETKVDSRVTKILDHWKNNS